VDGIGRFDVGVKVDFKDKNKVEIKIKKKTKEIIISIFDVKK